MRMKNLLIILILLVSAHSSGQMVFSYKKVPVESGLKMDGYWVWGGSAIKVGTTYHLFASRWKKDGPFPEGYRQGSEIVRATSRSPLGPFTFGEVVIGERDSSFWDSNMAHNPTIHKIGDEFVLFYIGSDFTTYYNKAANSLLRRVGYATAKSIEGPWKRCEKPVIDFESNNPAILVEEGKIKLMFRDNALKVLIAESDNYKGPYTVVNDNVWNDRLEDFYIFRSRDYYHVICEDNTGKISGHLRWGVHLVSENGVSDWRSYDPVTVYNHEIVFENDSILNCVRRERPQLLILKNRSGTCTTGFMMAGIHGASLWN